MAVKRKELLAQICVWWTEWYSRRSGDIPSRTIKEQNDSVDTNIKVPRELSSLISEVKLNHVTHSVVVDSDKYLGQHLIETAPMSYSRDLTSILYARGEQPLRRSLEDQKVTSALRALASQELQALKGGAVIMNSYLSNLKLAVGLQRPTLRDVEIVDCDLTLDVWYGCVMNTTFRNGSFMMQWPDRKTPKGFGLSISKHGVL